MLALLGFLTVAVLFVLIVSRLASPLVALIAVLTGRVADPFAVGHAGGSLHRYTFSIGMIGRIARQLKIEQPTFAVDRLLRRTLEER